MVLVPLTIRIERLMSAVIILLETTLNVTSSSYGPLMKDGEISGHILGTAPFMLN